MTRGHAAAGARRAEHHDADDLPERAATDRGAGTVG